MERAAGGDGGVSANIFQTTIELAATGTRLDTLANTLVLPFFPAPVESGSGELGTPPGAFDWGCRPGLDCSIPSSGEGGTTYFGRIAQTLESCLIGNATVELDMIGLASPSWDGGDRRDDGRDVELPSRRGAARRGAPPSWPDYWTRRIGTGSACSCPIGTTMALPEIIDLATAGAPVSEMLARFARFGSSSQFEERRDTLLAVTGLNPDVESPLEELFGRSVVLRVVTLQRRPLPVLASIQPCRKLCRTGTSGIARPDPIPFFGELGSVKPVFLCRPHLPRGAGRSARRGPDRWAWGRPVLHQSGHRDCREWCGGAGGLPGMFQGPQSDGSTVFL